ncbi:MAG: DNA-processing protein DprA [Clostridia bacterium]|nr:DNA-processing protein DprA [Clostridia bacterium]
MKHNDDAFATMLLMSQLSANKEEIVRPLSVAEFYELRDLAASSGLKGMGDLIGMDLNTMRRRLNLGENEAYRLCVLLGRVMPLSYALERFSEGGIDIATLEEAAYPRRLVERLGQKAPPMIYSCGSPALAAKSSMTVISNTCARPDVLECACELAALACDAGIVLVTGGEIGFGRLIEREAMQEDGRVISFLAESLVERIYQPGLSELIANERALALSIIHPEAKYTVSHALERNKCLFALSDASFILSCEKGKGTAWEGAASALRNGYAERMYVWDNPAIPGNTALIAQGAIPFRSPHELALETMKASWETPAYEQLSLF